MQYTLRQVSEKIGVSIYTIRYWVKEGKIATVRTLGGHHRVTQKELDHLLGKRGATEGSRIIIYSRVSSAENKANLERQVQRLSDYSTERGYQIDRVLREIGSGINDSRKKLLRLMDYVSFHPIDKIVVEHKDRLTCFGFTYLEKYFKEHGVEIEVVNETKARKEDLMDDFVSIITYFVARLYGLRKSKSRTEKLIQELVGQLPLPEGGLKHKLAPVDQPKSLSRRFNKNSIDQNCISQRDIAVEKSDNPSFRGVRNGSE